ncbi:predicted protein [Chaetoceros tenuissimus]|uniref:Uncharacterized protein n=1 Tax=Chaetoceros tenuissimus TaxID=426638 RepID=A0AAD3CIE5_9STRA|nr:predicted protein [Chaetoceros tenuissimus]
MIVGCCTRTNENEVANTPKREESFEDIAICVSSDEIESQGDASHVSSVQESETLEDQLQLPESKVSLSTLNGIKITPAEPAITLPCSYLCVLDYSDNSATLVK